MGQNAFEDRRTFQRFSVDLPLTYSKPDQQTRTVVETRDISAQGIGVTLDEELAPGTPLYVMVRLPQSTEEFPAEGTIIWSRNCGNSFRAGIRLKRAELMDISTIIRMCHLRVS